MKKRTIAMLLLSALVLSACGSKKEVKEKEKIDVSLFEENDSKRSKYKGYTVEEVYINGEKVKIDVQSHGDHYHIIYNGKKYSLDKEKYEELFKKDNKIVLESENMEKSLKDISPDEIISYYKHGDHWHVKTKHGEFITHEDPSKIKNISQLKENSIKTISKKELNSKKIVSYYKHGDHWHVRTADGKEYVTYEDPSKKTVVEEKKSSKVVKKITEKEKKGRKIVGIRKHGDHWHVKLDDGTEYVTYENPTKKDKIDEKKSSKVVEKITEKETKGRKIVGIRKHGDHWHVKLDDGTEYITKKDPTGKKELPSEKEMEKEGDFKKDFEMHFHDLLQNYFVGDETKIRAHSSKKSVKSYSWYIKRNGKAFEKIENANTETLKIILTEQDNGAIIKAEALDKDGKVVDTCQGTLKVLTKNVGDVVITGLKDHYHTKDKLSLLVNCDENDVNYVWYLKKRAQDFEKVFESKDKSFNSTFSLDSTYNRAIIKVAVYKNGVLLKESNPVKIIVNDHNHGPAFKGEPEIGKKLLKKKGFDERLIYALMLAEGDIAFPGKEISDTELENYLKSIKKINLYKFNDALKMSGLEKLENLESLNISYTGATNSDIETLKKFKNLKDLNISGNNITKFDFISEYKNLEGLSIMELGNVDLSFVKNLKDLKKLNISRNDIQSFSFISNLSKLDTLIMDYVNCDNLDFLKNTTKLKNLSLDGNRIKDLTPIKNNKFETLYVSETGIKDFSTLGNQENLIAIFANGNNIDSLKVFSNFKNVEFIEAEKNNISSLEDVKLFPLLETLKLGKNPIKSLKISKDNNSIKTLNLNETLLENLEYKIKFKSLTSLEYSNTPALKSELGKVENIQKNTAGIIFYDGKYYAISHGDHSHTYAGTQSVNPTKVKFKFDNSEIIGFDETGYFINHKVATLSDGSEYFNIYHIDGFPKGAFELPNSMSEKLKVSEEIVSKLVKHRISEVENLIKSKENKTELFKKFEEIKKMENTNEKFKKINEFEKKVSVEKEIKKDNKNAEFEKYKKLYEENKDKVSVSDQAYIESLINAIETALTKNNESFAKEKLKALKTELSKYIQIPEEKVENQKEDSRKADFEKYKKLYEENKDKIPMLSQAYIEGLIPSLETAFSNRNKDFIDKNLPLLKKELSMFVKIN